MSGSTTTNHSFSEDFLFTIVNGTIVNNSNNTINSAEINIQFYGENGTLIPAILRMQN
jgi:hypothetical protein